MFVFALTFGFNHFNFPKRNQLLNFGTSFCHFVISCFKHALKVALRESVKGKWDGDIDLGDGKLQELRTAYDARRAETCIRGIEWSIQNDASRKISAESRNLGNQNKSLGILGSLHVEPSRSLEFL